MKVTPSGESIFLAFLFVAVVCFACGFAVGHFS